MKRAWHSMTLLWSLAVPCALGQVAAEIRKDLKSGREDVRADAVRAAALVGADAVPLLLPIAAADRDARVRDTAFQELGRIDGPEAIAHFTKGLRAADAAERAIAAEIIGVLGAAGVGAALRPLLDDKDAAVRLAAATAAGLCKAAECRDALVAMVDASADPLLRAVAIESVSRIGDEGTVELLERWLQSDAPGLAVAALTQLRFQDRDRAEAAIGDVLARAAATTESSPLLRQAIEEAVRVRRKGPLPGLVGLLDHPRPRIAHQAWLALREITGKELPFARTAWQEWWDHYGESFTVPRKDDAGAGAPAPASGSRVRFFDAPIDSDRVVFVIDFSGSMRDPDAQGTPKIDRARAALQDALAALGPEARFNVIAFGDEPRLFRKELVPADRKNVDDAGKFARSAGAKGKTNVFDALELALHLADVDTVVLLSDGAPSAGRFEHYGRIRFQLLRDNKIRKVAISVVALQTGDKAQEFLRRLAEDTGGTYLDR